MMNASQVTRTQNDSYGNWQNNLGCNLLLFSLWMNLLTIFYDQSVIRLVYEMSESCSQLPRTDVTSSYVLFCLKKTPKPKGFQLTLIYSLLRSWNPEKFWHFFTIFVLWLISYQNSCHQSTNGVINQCLSFKNTITMFWRNTSIKKSR